jgi:hypothetical protein
MLQTLPRPHRPHPPHLHRIDNAHIHARAASVVQEGAVEGAPHCLVAAEAEGNVGHAAADLGAGAQPLDLPRGTEEVHRIVVVLRQARAHGQDVGVKDDVLGVEAHLLHQDTVGAAAHGHLLRLCCRLARLVKGHHHDGGAMALDELCVRPEGVLALLEGDAVDDALALGALEARLHNVELGGVNHERHAADLRVWGGKRQKSSKEAKLSAAAGHCEACWWAMASCHQARLIQTPSATWIGMAACTGGQAGVCTPAPRLHQPHLRCRG